MSGRARPRPVNDARLAALVDEALAPPQLEAWAHPEDWPLGPGGASTGLANGLWDRAVRDVARDILSRPSRLFRARLAELSFRLAGGVGDPPRWLAASSRSFTREA